MKNKVEASPVSPIENHDPQRLEDVPALRARRVTDVRELLGDAREGILVLDGETYRLRITSRRKLILTK